MADALWITQQDIIDNSVFVENIDVQVLTPNILYVQDEHIQNLLGTDLFNSINSQIIANTVTALNATLLDSWIKKVIVNYVLSESAADLVYRWTNKGIVVKTADNSNAITPEQLEYIIERYRNRAIGYARRLTLYLVQESNSYPLYNSNSDISDVRPSYLHAKTGIYLGDSDNDCSDFLHNGQTRS